MSRIRALAVANPVPSVLTVAAVLATGAAVVTVAGPSSTRGVLRIVALAVVLWLFAGGFWASALDERRD